MLLGSGITLDSQFPTLLLIHSNCICSQIHNAFQSPSISTCACVCVCDTCECTYTLSYVRKVYKQLCRTDAGIFAERSIRRPLTNCSRSTHTREWGAEGIYTRACARGKKLWRNFKPKLRALLLTHRDLIFTRWCFS